MFNFASIMLTVTLALNPSDRVTLVQGQGIVESGLNRFAVGKAKEQGAWQVIEKYHGKTPKDLRGQLDQHIKIMDNLLVEQKGNIEMAITRYNGAGKKAKRYYATVRKKTLELHIIGV